jgi:triacylglycerol lipase
MTLATFLRIGLAVQLGAGFAVATWLLRDGLAWLAVPLALAVPLVGTALGLAIEFAVGARIDPRSPPLPLQALFGIWWQETAISARMFAFSQLFAARFPEPPIVRDPQRPAVLLVHGYLCNRAVWRALLASGQLDGCNVATVNLVPIFGPIERYADVVHEAVERLRSASGAAQVVLVGHSMGGLAVRSYLTRFGDAAIRKVVTLATPHHGTIFGALGAGANAKQMAVGSRFLQRIAHEIPSVTRAKFVCVASRDDNLIVPRSSPLLPGTRQVLLDRVGHLAMIEDARAWGVVRAELGPEPAAAAPEVQRMGDSAM